MSTGTSELLHSEGSAPTETVLSGEERAITARSPLQLFWRRFRKDRVAMTALGFIVLLILVAVFSPLIVKALGQPDPNLQETSSLDSFGLPSGPSSDHLFGVDQIGRDVFSRTIYGSRISLIVAGLATFLIVAIGTVIGMISGFYRGWVDTLLSRAMDVMLAFPVLLLALGLGAACSFGGGCLRGLIQPGLPVVIFVIVLAQWPYFARIIRGQVLSLREKEFIEAARSLGASNSRIIFREILPNLLAPIIVYTTLIIPTNILFEAALSFLGVGVQPPTATWGAMIAEATNIFDIAWWFMLAPGVALVLTVLAFNLVGDGLQDALNPKGDR
ncbi:MAG: peptide/nickel transport system permease protein [Solirubrobacteraceae bacterium]|nr:peptide/nickel transport system permease protein [Solirubrobacteraceae bacterium]